ncbi:phosphoribosyltransferase [Patescibacteria group bacterium]
MYKNRKDAGLLLAKKLAAYSGKNAVVVGLSRGGVVVAESISVSLKIPLDVLVVKKIPSPINPELGIGALAPDSVSYVDWKLAGKLGTDEAYVNMQIETLTSELKKVQQRYIKVQKKQKLKGKEIIITDDGVATGSTLRAAIKWVNAKSAKKIILALPVAPPEFVEGIKSSIDEIVVLETPGDLGAVGQYYKDFAQVTDEEVIEILKNGL